MKQTKSRSAVVPTWYGDIRNMFTDTDIDHMRNYSGLYGVDLSSYDYVSGHAGLIYQQVASQNMPPNDPWSQQYIDTFKSWMDAGCPKGTPEQTVLFTGKKKLVAPAAAATRVRKDITTLTAAELDTVTKAFTGMMGLGTTETNSYFKQAGFHWLPAPNLYCMHHAPGYNPWHRAYLLSFENAMRSIPGCANVTLPYWDITKPLPAVLQQPPFDAYTFQDNVGPPPYDLQGKKTQRFDWATIKANLLKYGVTDKINKAMAQTTWEAFHGYFASAIHVTIISAHDSGHNSIGPTMQDQDIAAFDPIFWFFHCNWDRLFWEWQKKMGATTLNKLLSTIDKVNDPTSFQTFTDPVVGALTPFPQHAADIVDSVNSLDVDYGAAKTVTEVALVQQTKVASSAARSFAVNTDTVNVRVKGLNRLKIPGSFDVHLLKDGKPIASTGFFQPHEADKCASCVQNAIVHFDFELPLSAVKNGKLGVWVEPINKDFIGDRFPAKLMGSPTVEVHFLVAND